MNTNTENFCENYETYKNDFINKVRALRNEKNISAREMSLALGQNVNYINLIENGKRLPSMQGFFAICDYLKISPSDFFNTKIQNNLDKESFLAKFQALTSIEAEHIMLIMGDILK